MKTENSSTIVPLKAGLGPLKRFQYLSDVKDIFDIKNRHEATLHVVILADDMHPANVVQDHINAIAELSDHVCTVVNPRVFKTPSALQFTRMDAVILHYSIFALADTYLSDEWKKFIREFNGIKAMIHEDEYQQIIRFREFMSYVGINAVFSCLDSPKTLEQVYGVPELSHTSFFSCLAGYIPDYFDQLSGPPQADRNTHIIYRGRTLAPQLGRFAQEKRLIGDRVAKLADKEGLKYDISSEESSRIYGPAWNRFLQKGRAMIGVEGGASIFDFDGTLAADAEAYQVEHPDADFENVWSELLAEHEGNIDFRTITPKFFEAIASRTGLILYPGHYGGVLQAGRHYIELERDGSNFSKVANRLRDAEYMQELVDQAYEDIMGRSELRTRFFVSKIDQVLLRLFMQNNPDGATSGKVIGTPGRPVRADLILSGPAAVLRQQITSAEVRLAEVSQQAKTFDGHQTAALQELSDELRSRMRALQSDFGALQGSVDPRIQEIAAQEAQLASKLETIRELQSAHQRSMSETLVAFQGQDNALSEGLATLRQATAAERSQIRQDIDRLDRKHEQESQNVIDSHRASLEKQNEKIAAIDAERAAQEAQLASKLETIHELQSAHQRSMSETLVALQGQDNALSEGLATLRQAADAECVQIRQDIDRLDRKHEQVSQNIIDDHSAVLEKQDEKIAAIDAERAALKAADAALESQFTQIDAAVGEFRKRIDAVEVRSTELTAAEFEIKSQLTTIVEFNRGIQGQLRDLSANDEDFRRRFDDFTEADGAICAEIVALSERLEVDISDIRISGSEMAKSLATLNSSGEVIRCDVDSLISERDVINEKIASLGDEKLTLEIGYQDIQSKIESLNANRQELSDGQATLVEANLETRLEIQELKETKEAVTTALVTMRNDNVALNASVTDLKQSSEVTASRVGGVEVSSGELKSKISEIEVSLETYSQVEAERLKSLQADLKSQLRLLTRHEKSVAGLKTRIVNQRSEFTKSIRAAEKRSIKNRSAIQQQAEYVAALNTELFNRLDVERATVHALQAELGDALRQEFYAFQSDVRGDLSEQANGLEKSLQRLDQLDTVAGRFDVQITGLQNTVAGESERLNAVSNNAADALSRLESTLGRIDSIEQFSRRVETALTEVRADYDSQIARLTKRILTAELHAAHYRRWHEETNARIDLVCAKMDQSLESVNTNVLAVRSAVNSQHHIFETWKAALKARIFAVLRIRQ